MDVGHTNGWRLDDVVPAAEIVARIGAELPLEPVEPAYRGEVAKRWRYVDGSGEIGVIASVTQPFCGDCTRARLSADGQALHLPLRRPRPRPARARPARVPRRRVRRRAARGARAASGRPRTTATPSSAPSRDRRPAEGRDVLHRRLTSRARPTDGTATSRRARSSTPRGPAIATFDGRQTAPQPPGTELTDAHDRAAGRATSPSSFASSGSASCQLALWLGFGLVYQVARGIADRSRVRGVPERRHWSSTSSAASARADRARHPAGRRLHAGDWIQAVNLDVLALAVHGRRARAALGLLLRGTTPSHGFRNMDPRSRT